MAIIFGDAKEGAFAICVAGTMAVDVNGGGQILNRHGQNDDQAWADLQRLGNPGRAGEIMEPIAGNELLANSYDRIAEHLRAKGVDIDGKAVITLDPMREFDAATEKFMDSDAANKLRARTKQRGPFAYPIWSATAHVGRRGLKIVSVREWHC